MRKANRAASIFLAFPVSLYLAFLCLLLTHHSLPIPIFIIISIVFYVLLRITGTFLGPKVSFNLEPRPSGPAAHSFVYAFLSCFLVLLLYLAAYFPGGISSDTCYQWWQIHGQSALTDWHPALHTFFLWALTRICDHPTFCLVVQMALYAAATGYCSATLYRIGTPRILQLLIIAYLVLSPGITNLMTFLWKDCAFSTCVLVLMTQLLSIRFSDGFWLDRKRNALALSIFLCLSSILRHNGPALTLPVCIWLLISCRNFRKTIIVSIMGFFLFFGLIRGPLYALAGVDNEFHPLDEVIGVPMTILSNVYVNAPESLDPDIVAYMEDVAPYDTYKNYNTVGDWNDIKGHIGYIYTDRPYSLAEVFSFAVRAWQAEPDLAAEALSYLWQMPLWPVSDAYWRMSPYCEPLEGLSTTGIPFFRRILGWVCRLTAEPVLSWLFWLPGFTMLVLTITCSIIGPSRPKLALLLAAGLLPYHLATSMFLSSSTDYRFYLGLQIAAPLCLISLLFSSGTTYAAKSIQPSNEG